MSLNRRSFMRLVAGAVIGGPLAAVLKSEEVVVGVDVASGESRTTMAVIFDEWAGEGDCQYFADRLALIGRQSAMVKLKWSSVGIVADWSPVDIFT